MKIITCAPLPPPHGGIAHWYEVLCAEAARRQYTFLNIDTSPRKSIDGRSLFYRVVVQGFRMLSQRREMKRLIRRHADVCAAHVTTSGQLGLVRDILFLSLLKRKNIRSVYHLHFGTVPTMFERKGLEYRLFCKAASLATDIVSMDPKTYATLQKALTDSRVHYIPNPVDADVKETLADSFRVLFLGNVLPAKGVEELLKAWQTVRNTHPDWTLTIAGFCEDDYKEALSQRYDMAQVEWLGFVPHHGAMELLAQSAFLVLPSYSEGFPNVVLEAMMREKAVIGTDVGAIGDMLAGDCGIVIEPARVEPLQTALEDLMNDPSKRRAMGERGRKKAVAQYATPSVFDRYAALWRNTDQ